MNAHSVEKGLPDFGCPECFVAGGHSPTCPRLTAEQGAADLLARLRDEVIAVVAEGLWDGDSDRGQPDYDRIAALYDDAASNVLPPGVGA
jgi:hypothetical protein